ncbi:Sulfatase [Rubripirellula lacrimiformis]|uniref:Sulfatase n=1 Tax=Rubripirellula lacrimiformis TaxID=1930273 RepID=A0A517NFX5_9BACT|nr:sulfatase-like hydrolase/transferase [Rubripirellula lacrimiformis]QDT06057.1 Sulfatase [Rubripirellula lacrimiformis]
MTAPSTHRETRLFCLAVAASITMTMMVGVSAMGLWPQTSAGHITAVAIESIALLMPIAWLGCYGGVWMLRFGALLCGLAPMLWITDTFLWRWTGHHLWSSAMGHVATDLRDGLIGYLSPNIAWGIASLGGWYAAWIALAVWVDRYVAKRVDARWPPRTVGWTAGTATAIAWCVVGIGIPPAELAGRSSPLVSLRIRSIESDAPRRPQTTASNPPTPHLDVPTSDADTQRMSSAIQRREIQQRILSTTSSCTGADCPDVLIIVAESFRPELVSADGTPHLWQLAQQGIWCRQHFSGGNATNHGMFSLVSGLEAIWHSRPVRFTPPLNRLFRLAGYEVGFFAGHDDWRTFRMDGYIDSQHYDRFETQPHDSLASDRQATIRASEFLRRDPQSPRRPRLALLYLYATHATFDSYPEDRHFSPAADDRFPIPYPPRDRLEVWNRYRNAAVTVDRFIGAIATDRVGADECVIVVTGDHGEAFLEDGTIGHGTRLSPQQNMTPAIIRIPTASPRIIDAPTMHADILPTVLQACGITVNNPSAMDGIALQDASNQSLRERVLVTRNYFDDEVAVIQGDASMDTRANVSLTDAKFEGQGNAWSDWLKSRFPK